MGIEADLDHTEGMERIEDGGHDQPACHRIGYREAAQPAHAVVDRLAQEVGDEAEGHRHEVGELDRLHHSSR